MKELLAGAQQGLDASSDEYAMVVLLRRKLGDVLFPNGDFSSFRGYKRSWELVDLMTIAPKELPQEVLLYGLRHAREEVREAALGAIAASIDAGEHRWIARLRNSSSAPVFQAYLRSALRHDARPLKCCDGHSCLTEFVRLRNLAQAATPSEAKARAREVLRLRLPGRLSVFAKGLLLLKTGRLSTLLNLCERLPRKKANAAMEAIGAGISAKDYKTLLMRFARWVRKPAEWFESSSNYAKALALSEAIYGASRPDLMPILRREISRLPLKWPSGPLFLAILKHGNMRDLRTLVNLIVVSKERIDVWNHTQIGHEAAALATKSLDGIPKYLAEMLHRKDFWGYLSAQARRAAAANEILPLKDPDNRPFLIRLVGYAVIGAAQKNDQETLVRLCSHNYPLIAREAALRLAHLFGDRALVILAERVDTAVRERTIESLATAVIYAEMSIYGLTSPAQHQ